MKAILVTETNKTNNADFFANDSVDSIVKKNLPSKYNGVENINAGGYQSRTDLHLQDGFRDIVVPTIDALIEKITNNFIDTGDTYTYEVVPLTQAEIDANLDSQDEIDEDFNEEAGLQLIKRYRKRLRRRIADGRLTAERGKQLRRWFSQIFYHLRNGDWDLAQDDILSPTFPVPTNNDLTREINWFKDRLNDFITMEYQSRKA